MGGFPKNEKLKLELFKLKAVTPKRRMKDGRLKLVSYTDVIWFLIEHYHKTKEGINDG